ncbi:MAG TPA: YncE family protein [Thermoplasmata archaeon]|nr:YncE family protein [Thermoplasmata archaeon]
MAIALVLLVPGISGTVPTPKSCATGSNPSDPAYDPVHHYIYVPDYFSNEIQVYKGTCTLVHTFVFGNSSTPNMAAFDPQNNFVYVTDTTLNCVYALRGTSLIGTITGFSGPVGIAFDPGDGIMLVTNYYSTNVTEISGLYSGPNITVGYNAIGINYDPYFDTMIVDNWRSSSVTILNASLPTNPNYGTFSIPAGAYFSAFNPNTDLDYIVNDASPGGVSVILGTGTFYFNLTLPAYPTSIAFSPVHLEMYAANYVSNSVSVISGGSVVKTIKFPGGSDPFGMTYDDANNVMFVTGSGNGRLYELH